LLNLDKIILFSLVLKLFEIRLVENKTVYVKSVTYQKCLQCG